MKIWLSRGIRSLALYLICLMKFIAAAISLLKYLHDKLKNFQWFIRTRDERRELSSRCEKARAESYVECKIYWKKRDEISF
jgi:hypothetical protein